MNEKKINFAAVEVIKLLGELEMTPREALESVMKSMHFIIEKGFCQTEEKTAELVSKAIGAITLSSAITSN